MALAIVDLTGFNNWLGRRRCSQHRRRPLLHPRLSGGTSHLAKIRLTRPVLAIYNTVLQSQQDRRVVRMATLALQSPLQHSARDVAGNSMFYRPARNGDTVPREFSAGFLYGF
jgi:hypothetical protein